MKNWRSITILTEDGKAVIDRYQMEGGKMGTPTKLREAIFNGDQAYCEDVVSSSLGAHKSLHVHLESHIRDYLNQLIGAERLNAECHGDLSTVESLDRILARLK